MMRQRFLSFLGATRDPPPAAPKERSRDLAALFGSRSILSSGTNIGPHVVVEAHGVGPVEMHFTQYTVICTQPGAHQWWVTFHRYSEFAAFRKQCSRMLKSAKKSKYAGKMNQFLEILEMIGMTPFPKKHLVMDDQFILQERKEGLAVYIQQVLTGFDDVVRLLQFLGKEERQVVEEWVAYVMKFLSMPPRVRHSRRRHTTLSTADAICSICLGKIDQGEGEKSSSIFETKCHHQYHRKCIVPWLEKTQTCPMCRHRVMSGRWF
ncbi:hypothetical protein THRCLA_00315 [Thraustotheca clavata]|uniref:RING-type E3 ubiquitin transferase n=1 Tax=Thraustotheca clavata TaxID=74557 RepID=A0A1W0ABM9_9STRA|nr:hypothetical protein THRCLA_00315 [Thraustotheca clavata]